MATAEGAMLERTGGAADLLRSARGRIIAGRLAGVGTCLGLHFWHKALHPLEELCLFLIPIVHTASDASPFHLMRVPCGYLTISVRYLSATQYGAFFVSPIPTAKLPFVLIGRGLFLGFFWFGRPCHLGPTSVVKIQNRGLFEV
jgi:hypothetical protein